MKPLLRRCLQFIPVFFGITLLSFGLLYIAPSDPVSIRLTEDGTAANPEVVARMRAEMGRDMQGDAAGESHAHDFAQQADGIKQEDG